MRDTQQANKVDSGTRGTKRRLRLLMIVVLSFFGWAAFTFWNQAGSLSDKSEKLTALNQQLAEVRKTNENFKQQVTRLNDDEYVEQKARKDFQMTRKGDTLFYTSNP